MGFFEFDKLYHRASSRSSLRPIVRLVVEIQCLVCDRATPPIIEKFGLKALLCTCMAFPHTARDPEINYMDLGGAVQNERKD